MRLLNTKTLKLDNFVGKTVPPYAILSHTWGSDEILFQDVQTDVGWQRLRLRARKKEGFAKVLRSCEQARRDGYGHIWIDACCIDKSSSAELSEAINSMFKWYRGAGRCYAYLVDVEGGGGDVPGAGPCDALERSRWFTRGWTLQELIAPDQVEFFDRHWRLLGERRKMVGPLARITGIAEAVLSRNHDPQCAHNFVHAYGACTNCGVAVTLESIMESFSVATRMSWASGRETTREEDMAYCLLGIFNIHMPLLYGEGGSRAFLRLQEEIMRSNSDQSILASYGASSDNSLPFYESRLFAASPSAFRGRYSIDLGPAHPGVTPLMASTNHGLNVDLLVCPCAVEWTTVSGARWDLITLWLGILDCSLDKDFLSRPAILLERVDTYSWTFRRIGYNLLFKILPNADRAGVDVEMPGDNLLRRFEVSFSHETIAMRSVCLLTSSGLGVKYVTSPLRIKLRQETQNYSLKASYPRCNGDYIPPVEIKVRSYMENTSTDENLCGVLCFDNGTSDGFFVAWGMIPGRTGSGALTTDSESSGLAPPPKTPWCKIIEWRRIMGEDYCSDAIRGDHSFANGEMRIRFLNREAHRKKISSAGPKVSIDTRSSPVRVTTKINSVDFLGRSVLELDVEVDSPGMHGERHQHIAAVNEV